MKAKVSKSGRVDPTPAQRRRLYAANAKRCCVCKRRGVGLHIHHIDGNHANTVDENLAVLCTEDHDAHHRPGSYPRHLELPAEQVLNYKVSWEAFVAEASKPKPEIVATVTAYGTVDLVHAIQIAFQRNGQPIEFVFTTHLLDGNMDKMTTEVVDEATSISPNIPLALINQPMPVEHCPCCGNGYSNTINKVHAAKLTDPKWATESAASVYINPVNPSLAITAGCGSADLYSGSLHLCNGTHLHFHCDYFDERIKITPKPSVRAQATRIVEKVLRELDTAHVFIGTGPGDNPLLIEGLNLPVCWEKAGRSRVPRADKRARS